MRLLERRMSGQRLPKKRRNGAATVRERLYLTLTALFVRGSVLADIFVIGGGRSAGHGEICDCCATRAGETGKRI